MHCSREGTGGPDPPPQPGNFEVATGFEFLKLQYSLKLKIKRNDWLLADTCQQAANQCALF